MARVVRKWLCLASLCVITLFAGCANFTNIPENRVAPPFYKVTDSETGGFVYMLGTMHTGLANTVYPDEVYSAFDECDTLAVEVDLIALESNPSELNNAMTLLLCKDNTTRELLGEDYDRVKDSFIQKRLYSAAYERYLPCVWTSAFTNKLAADCGFSNEYGTDREFVKRAIEQSKQIYEIESVKEQYQMNADESEALQAYTLISAVDTDWDEQKGQLTELYSAWSKGDISALEAALAAEAVPEELTEDYADFYYDMYENRQRKMADYIINELENGSTTFVAVGALHFAATPDIIDFLEDEGYTVERIEPVSMAA